VAFDRDGNPVSVGARVRILRLSDQWFEELPDGARDGIAGMIGQTFEVAEVDEFGRTWIHEPRADGVDDRFFRSISLSADEMLVVND
jgi:hypothetical protein